MMRVVLDTQSNRHFRGIQFEQRYDQRGGLCQVGEDGIIVTTDPFDSDYLRYWKELGFKLPQLIVAGPFDPDRTLSELVLSKPEVQTQIKSSVNGQPVRLEFFCVEESEQRVATVLGIEPYCNFNVSIPLSRKPVFKRFFDELGIPTPVWFPCCNKNDLLRCGSILLDADKSFVVKDQDGTGGIGCNSMFKVGNWQEFHQALNHEHDFGNEFIVEELLNRAGEVSVHWEIGVNAQARVIGLFDQVSQNYGYTGVNWPASISTDTYERILYDLHGKMIPALQRMAAYGFFCCDIIIDSSSQPYWIDLNPRKGAILYVYDMVRRLSEIHFNGEFPYFTHEHLQLPTREKSYTFKEVRKLLSGLLIPSRQQPFIVVSNSGVIPFGYLDMTAISYQGRGTARELLENTKELIAR